MRNHTWLWAIVLVYLVVGGLFAWLTPDWQTPDEPAHYNYVRQLAEGTFPVMQPGDYDQAYIVQLVFQSHFAPQYAITPLTYEDWQPPLYYVLLTPLFWLTGGSLLALRLVSLLLGVGVVGLAYGVAWRAFPGQRWLAEGTAVFVAFLPQHLSILASVNNDVLAELLIAALLWQVVGINDWHMAQDKRPFWFTGILLGLGYLTKATVYPLTAVVALALLWRWWGKWRDLVLAGVWLFLPAFCLGALWWGRNLALYGGLDILGKAAHDAVVIGQPRTADLIAQVGLGSAIYQFGQTTFHSFWGQFGWMTLPMLHPGWLYPLLGVFTAVAISGLALDWFSRRQHQAPPAGYLSPLFLLFLLTTAVHLWYNLTFIQHQGRYLFPALIPIGLGTMIGLGGWIRPLTPRWPFLKSWLPLALGLFFVLLDLWALFRIIVPNLA